MNSKFRPSKGVATDISSQLRSKSNKYNLFFSRRWLQSQFRRYFVKGYFEHMWLPFRKICISSQNIRTDPFWTRSWKHKALGQNYITLFTVPYFFVRSFRYTASYRHGYILIFKCIEGVGIGDYSSGGGGEDEKNRGTVITTLQLAFTERVVPATLALASLGSLPPKPPPPPK